MASKRPPKTYSPSARTGRRDGGSGGVVGMVPRAGCDAWPRSLRSSAPVDSSAGSISRFRSCSRSSSSMRTSREACSRRGAFELSFSRATLHVSAHAH